VPGKAGLALRLAGSLSDSGWPGCQSAHAIQSPLVLGQASSTGPRRGL